MSVSGFTLNFGMPFSFSDLLWSSEDVDVPAVLQRMPQGYESSYAGMDVPGAHYHTNQANTWSNNLKTGNYFVDWWNHTWMDYLSTIPINRTRGAFLVSMGVFYRKILVITR